MGHILDKFFRLVMSEVLVAIFFAFVAMLVVFVSIFFVLASMAVLLLVILLLFVAISVVFWSMAVLLLAIFFVFVAISVVFWSMAVLLLAIFFVFVAILVVFVSIFFCIGIDGRLVVCNIGRIGTDIRCILGYLGIQCLDVFVLIVGITDIGGGRRPGRLCGILVQNLW